MGVTKTTIVKCTCDLCEKECQTSDGYIKISLNNGYKDVGSDYIWGVLKLSQSYNPAEGVICEACKIKWLKKYLEGK